MTNRQARREQSRSSRNLRGQRGRSQRSSPQQPKRSGGGGPGDFLSLPYLIGVGVVAVALAAVLVFVAMNSGGGDEEYVAALEDMDESFPADMADGLAVGDPDAPVTLTAYEDFTCPFCLRFTAENEPGIISDYVEEGLVRFEFQQYPLRGTEATNAAEAAQCAVQQDRFWDMHNKLFLEHAREGNPSSGLFSTDAVKGYAADIGLDTEAFNTCMDSDETLEEINTQAQDARSLGISGTPGFVINGQPMTGGSPQDMEGWSQVLDAAIEEAQGGEGAANGEDGGSEDDSGGATNGNGSGANGETDSSSDGQDETSAE